MAPKSPFSPIPDTCKFAGCSPATLLRWERLNLFPARIKLSSRKVAHRKSDLAQWQRRPGLGAGASRYGPSRRCGRRRCMSKAAIATPRLSNQLKIFSTRQKKRGHSRASPRQMVAFRLRDFDTLFSSRYRGGPLPDDDSGRDDIEPVIHHLAALPARRAQHWLKVWAPWLTLREQEAIVADELMNARKWTADQLACRYRVTRKERDMLGLTTIGATDFGKAARTKRRKELTDYARQTSAALEDRRRASNTRSNQFRAQNLGRQKASVARNGTGAGNNRLRQVQLQHNST